MTVCIAVICEDAGAQRIVLCSDTRLDGGESGTNDNNPKIEGLAYGWFSMMSGDNWEQARDLNSFIKKRFIDRQKPQSKADLHRTIEAATKDFTSSPFFNKSHVELLICGFVEDCAVIATIGAGGPYKIPSIGYSSSFAVAGSGTAIANLFLNLRKCVPGDSLARALYCAYEGKKYSENVSTVGPETALIVIGPTPEDVFEDVFSYIVIGPEKQQELESFRLRYGLQTITELPGKPGQPMELSTLGRLMP